MKISLLINMKMPKMCVCLAICVARSVFAGCSRIAKDQKTFEDTQDMPQPGLIQAISESFSEALRICRLI